MPMRAAPALRLSMSCSRLTYRDFVPWVRAFSCMIHKMRDVFIVPGVPRRAPCSLSGCRPRGRGPDHRRTSGEWEPRVPCHACHEILVIKPWRPRYRGRYSYAPCVGPVGTTARIFHGSPFTSVDKPATPVFLEPPSGLRRSRDRVMEVSQS